MGKAPKPTGPVAVDDPKWSFHQAAAKNMDKLLKLQQNVIQKCPEYIAKPYSEEIDRANMTSSSSSASEAGGSKNPSSNDDHKNSSAFKTNIKGLGCSLWLQPEVLMRFVRAKNGDFNEAEKMVIESAKWRENASGPHLNLDVHLKMMDYGLLDEDKMFCAKVRNRNNRNTYVEVRRENPNNSNSQNICVPILKDIACPPPSNWPKNKEFTRPYPILNHTDLVKYFINPYYPTGYCGVAKDGTQTYFEQVRNIYTSGGNRMDAIKTLTFSELVAIFGAEYTKNNMGLGNFDINLAYKVEEEMRNNEIEKLTNRFLNEYQGMTNRLQKEKENGTSDSKSPKSSPKANRNSSKDKKGANNSTVDLGPLITDVAELRTNDIDFIVAYQLFDTEKNQRYRNICCSIKQKRPMYFNTTIINVSGCSFSELVKVYYDFLQPFSKKLTEGISGNYPEGAGNMCIVGVPWGFESMCKLLFMFLPKSLSEKIVVARSFDPVKKFVLNDQLPAHMGGTMSDNACLDPNAEHLPWNDPEVLEVLAFHGFEKAFDYYAQDRLEDLWSEFENKKINENSTQNCTLDSNNNSATPKVKSTNKNRSGLQTEEIELTVSKNSRIVDEDGTNLIAALKEQSSKKPRSSQSTKETGSGVSGTSDGADTPGSYVSCLSRNMDMMGDFECDNVGSRRSRSRENRVSSPNLTKKGRVENKTMRYSELNETPAKKCFTFCFSSRRR